MQRFRNWLSRQIVMASRRKEHIAGTREENQGRTRETQNENRMAETLGRTRASRGSRLARCRRARHARTARHTICLCQASGHFGNPQDAGNLGPRTAGRGRKVPAIG